MTGHTPDELPLLLTGEATREIAHAAAAHLRTCADCRHELVSAVVAHAALTSAHRFAPELVARPAREAAFPLVEPDPDPDPEALPIFAQIRDETAGDVDTTHRTRGRRYVAAAVAAGVLVGTGGTVVIHNQGHSRHSITAGRSISLAAYGTGTVPAKATLTGDHKLDVDASSLPEPDTDTRYEVWLTNNQGTRMQPVGWLGTDGNASFTVPAALLAHYDHIQVSVQNVAAPQYTISGTNVLRGSYAG